MVDVDPNQISQKVTCISEVPRLTTRQVAELFDRHPNTIRAWVQKGKLAAHKIDGQLSFAEADVNALIRSSKLSLEQS